MFASRLLLRQAPSSTGHASLSAASRIQRWRKVTSYILASTAALLGLSVSQLYISSTRMPTSSTAAPKTQAELIKVYDDTAHSFDADVNLSERLMGLTRARRSLVGQCKGHVLEVSCGTARNLGYYKFGDHDGVKSLTLADLSAEMVAQGKQKWAALKTARALPDGVERVPVRFWMGDVKGAIPAPPGGSAAEADRPKGYDTIVQSMGLCSTDEPTQLLQNLTSHLNSENPDAKILLLEHGRSYYEWWNGVLDSQASTHASKHGCWWNRDIGAIVSASGLEVVREKRQNFGTTWIYELKRSRQVGPGRSTPASNDGDQSISHPVKTWEDMLPRWMYERICKR